MSSLLIVEDEVTLARALQQGLREEGYEVDISTSVAAARIRLSRQPVDLVILDLTLPEEDGLVLLNEIRASASPIPVVIITARGLLANRLDGLNRGADDYLVKPFAVAELVARTQAVLRRTGERETILHWGPLRADLNTHSIKIESQALDLTAREVLLLVYLMRLQGRPASREMLAQEVWRIQSRATSMDNVIDVSMSRLRRKLADHPSGPPLLTVRGVGYRLGDVT